MLRQMIPKDPERLIRQLGGFLSLNGFLRNVFLQDVHMNVDRTEGKGSAEDLVRAAECGKHDPAVGILCDLQRSRTEGKQRIRGFILPALRIDPVVCIAGLYIMWLVVSPPRLLSKESVSFVFGLGSQHDTELFKGARVGLREDYGCVSVGIAQLVDLIHSEFRRWICYRGH